MSRRLKIAVFLSGGGRTLQNFLDRIEDGSLPASIELVIASRRDAYGLVRAEKAGIPSHVVPSRRFKRDWSRFSEAVNEILFQYEADLIALAGFMCLYLVPSEFESRVMNIHPALIPSFCGEGLYGERVHRRVIESGVKVTGCTVHFVDNTYDHGPIIIQRTCPVLDEDTPRTLAGRVFDQECIAYPEAINLFAQGRLQVAGRRVKVLPAHSS